MKRTVKIFAWFSFLIGTGFLLSFANSSYDNIQLQKSVINIDKSNGHSFITENEVREIMNDVGVKLKGEQKQQVDIDRIENLLMEHSGTKNVEVYCFNNGELHIDIIQKTPIARILHFNGYLSYYLDEDGKVMSLNNNYYARVPVFSGFINHGNPFGYNADLSTKNEEHQFLDEIYRLATAINKDEFLKSQIVQVYVNQDGEYELIPRIGNHRVLFGKVINENQKLKKIKLFYTESLSNKQLNMYDTLNIMYNNQIVCSKR